jgi:NAD(P)H-hydrate epimerase
MVLDADALNIVATDLDVLGRCAGPRLLTPHPGEMARLLGQRNEQKATDAMPRRELAKKFVDNFAVTLLFKGARTIVAERERPLAFNTTGSPGMATGGMGDVLTGVCAAMLGHGLSPYDAARVAAWLCGRAAELAITCGGESEESLSAGRLRDHLGAAFKALRARSY